MSGFILFHIKSFCILLSRSIISFGIVQTSAKSIILAKGKVSKIVILLSKVKFLSLHNFRTLSTFVMFSEILLILYNFIIRVVNSQYFYRAFFQNYTFHNTEYSQPSFRMPAILHLDLFVLRPENYRNLLKIVLIKIMSFHLLKRKPYHLHRLHIKILYEVIEYS